MKTTRYYVLGTPERPFGLIRSTYDSKAQRTREITRYNSAIDDFVPDDAAAQWVLLGDTMLTEIPYGQVPDVRARIRVATRGMEPLAPTP